MYINKAKFEYKRPLFRKHNKILNVYQVSELNNVMFIYKISTKTTSYSYPTYFSESDYSLPAHNLRKSKFRLSIREQLLWNNFLTKTEKSLEIKSLFKSKFKNKLLMLEKEVKYF